MSRSHRHNNNNINNLDGSSNGNMEVISRRALSQKKQTLAAPPPRRLGTPYLVCCRCSRPSLSVDVEGNPVGLTVSAFGDVLPLYCPGCDDEHTDYEPSKLFDVQGQHMAFKGDAELDDADYEPEPTPLLSGGAGTNELLSSTELNFLSSHVCVVCGPCGRQVLRVGADGGGLVLERSAYGQPLPLTCPSCHLTHTDWTVSTVVPMTL
eukprot:PhM_4_TR18207/c0_g1_i1/m.71615